jgi:hypothetical protein
MLQTVGEQVGRLWRFIIALALLFSFPIAGFFASFEVGFWVADLFGYGARSLLVLFVAFLFGLFLAIYVWEPHVKATTYQAFEAMISRKS